MYDSDGYRRNARQVQSDVTWTVKRVALWILGLFVAIAIMGFVWTILSRPAALVEKVTDPDKIISNYEEFQEIYNTCRKIDSDLKTICMTADSDPMFDQFSKGAMIAQKRQLLTRWANEYNAKSKMITREYWKSPTLPYELNEEQFSNYNCNAGGGR